MKKILVLGAGLVGSAIIKDLSKSYTVLAADSDQGKLDHLENFPNIRTVSADLTDPGLFMPLAQEADLVVGALPGYLGYDSVRLCIEAGKNMVDISFFPEDPFTLDQFAREKGVTIVPDCGVAPGISNLILGHLNARMKIDRFRCLVGGLPVIRRWPWQYKAVFSPVDVLQEYIRPARFVENGQLVIKEALSDSELVEFEHIGTLEAFNSDGLRSLIKTMEIPNMIEKTLRYPGTPELLRILRYTGFLGEAPVSVGDHEVRPIDMTASLLFPHWKLLPDEPEFTIMQIDIRGFSDNRETRLRYELLDYRDPGTGISSMSRTTGYACTAVATLLANGKLSQPGINPTELIGCNEAHYNFIMSYLEERGIHFTVSVF